MISDKSLSYDIASAKIEKRKKTVRTTLTGIFSYGWVILVGLSTLLPYLWMLSNSLKPRAEIAFYRLLPVHPTLGNYIKILTKYPFGQWYLNTFIVTALSVISTLFFCSLAGYALAKFHFPGRNAFFIFILATVMVPVEMLILPWYVGAYKLNLINSYAGLVLPGLISAFGVFILRQSILNIPDDLIDAARVDGMSEPGIYFKIIIPLVAGPLSALAILTALGTWNDFLWPLIVVSKTSMFTMQVGVTYATQGEFQDTMQDWGTIMAAMTVASIPMLVLVVFAQKYIVKGITMTGLKG
ncbi:MAG: carbohydrate ABC transporter permease [Chloroflexi bacterium]|nr:carbohydrate ABC transporter permease [Chloroflexota bacterium]